MDKVLQIEFSGWTATPRMPFILSGNAVCMHTPSYSLLLGIIGCCLGRIVEPKEVEVGFHYSYDSVAKDIETRQRLEYDNLKIKKHTKGSDAYLREFHVSPKLILWINRTDWIEYFKSPIGTPSLGRSQDILKIDSVQIVEISPVKEAVISGCMLPFSPNIQAGGQLVQLAEAFEESEQVGGGRRPTKTGVFLTIPFDNKAKVNLPNLYTTNIEPPQSFYLHRF